jgi:hypothetical protein
MANFADQWVPNGPFPIVADTDAKGGLRVVADITERNDIPLLRQTVGMLVYVVSDGKTYRLTATGAPGTYVLHTVDQADLVGGFRVVADNTDRNSIPLTQQQVGMHVYVVSTDVMWRLTSTGAPPLSDANFTIASQVAHDTGIVSGCGVTNPSTNVVEMAAGILAHRGTIYAVPATLTATGLAANGEQIVVFNTLTKTLVWKSHGNALVTDLPVAFAAVTSSAFTKFEVISPVSALGFNAYEDVIVSVEVGLPAHFNSLHHAFLWLHAHGNLDTGPSIMKFVGDYAAFEERAGLPGTITNVPVGGPVVITGSGTRFLRDFAAGDWIGMGGTGATNRVWSRVNSVASDVSLTVASATAVTTPAVYTRAIMHGPHAETMDPSLAGLTDAFHGLKLVGVTTDGGGSGRGPLVEWGFRKSSGTTPDSDNVAVYGLKAATRRCLLSNIHFTVATSAAPGDYDACIVRGVGQENYFENVTFEGYSSSGQQGVSCHVNITDNPYPDIGSPSIKFSRCSFWDMGGASLTEKTVVRITASSSAGEVAFEGCAFDSNGSYTSAQADAASVSGIDLVFRDSEFNGVGTIAMFKHRKTSDVLTRKLLLSNCRIYSGSKFGVVSTADQTTDRAAVDLFDCNIVNAMDYLGCRTVRASIAGGTHTLNGKGGFILWLESGTVLAGEPRYLIRGDTGEVDFSGGDPGGTITHKIGGKTLTSGGVENIDIGRTGGAANTDSVVRIGPSANGEVRICEQVGITDLLAGGGLPVFVDALVLDMTVVSTKASNIGAYTNLSALQRVLPAGKYRLQASIFYSSDSGSNSLELAVKSAGSSFSPYIFGYGASGAAVSGTGVGSTVAGDMTGVSSSGTTDIKCMQVDGVFVIAAPATVTLEYSMLNNTPITVEVGSFSEFTRLDGFT